MLLNILFESYFSKYSSLYSKGTAYYVSKVLSFSFFKNTNVKEHLSQTIYFFSPVSLTFFLKKIVFLEKTKNV